MTKTLIMNKTIAEKLENVTFHDEENNMKYTFEYVPSFYNAPFELRVDVFEDDEWIHEFSGVYEDGEEVSSEYEPWVEWVIRLQKEQA